MHTVSFRYALGIWLRVAALSFGGPAGQIATMHRIIVDEERWIGEQRFLHALSFCTLLPGPEAQQLAIYIGWLMHGVRGGVAAGVLFVLPGLLSIMLLSIVYATAGHLPAIAALFFGLKCAVLAIVLQAVQRIGRRALRNPAMRAIAAGAFIAIFFANIPFPVIIVSAAVIGYAGIRSGSPLFQAGAAHGPEAAHQLAEKDSLLGETLPPHARANAASARNAALVWLPLWLAPAAILFAAQGPDATFTRIAVFFSETAVVTFGGAYAVLAYVAQQAVAHFHWLRPGEMLDGLGMAETTPGPLIIVTQFVGFMAAFRAPTGLPPLLAGALGGLLTTWVTFAPCFLWIFLGAPYVERLRANQALSGALAAVTAAVVGVILNLAIWFAMHTWFGQTAPVSILGLTIDAPQAASVNLAAVALSAAAMIAILRFKTGVIKTLMACAAAGLVLQKAGAL